MKKYLKLVSALCAIAMIACVFAGCAKDKKTAKISDGGTFSYWTVIDNSSSVSLTGYNDMLLYQELEKRTGIHIDFIHPIAGSTGNEAFVAMMSGDELPDMIEYNWSKYTGGAQQAIDDGVIISLNDYLEEYAPNYNDYMNGKKGKANGNLYKLQTITHAGQHYGFNGLNVGDTRVFSGLCIRGDLLEKWGMEIPETIDDWTAVFAKAKADGMQKPLTGINFDFSFTGSTPGFNTAFNVGKYYYVNNDKVVYAPFEKGFKEYVNQLAKWVKAGYLDTGFVTNDSATVQGNLANGISVAACGNIGGTIGTVVEAARKNNPSYSLVACPFPVAKKGDVAEYRSASGEASPLAIAISTQCGNYEQAVQWCDYLYGDEGMVLRNFGVEGDTFTKEEIDGETHYIYTDKILKPELSGVTSVSEAMYKYMLPANHPGLNQHPDYLNGYYQLDEQKNAMEIWNKDIDKVRKHILPTLDFTEDEAREKTDIVEVVDAELEVAVSDIILGRKSISTFDAAVKKAWDGGYDRVMEIYQAAYDRYVAKLK